MATAALSLASLNHASAAITVDAFDSLSSNASTVEMTFDASGSDKLVVVMTGEHGFNQSANGDGGDVTYDGVLMTQLVDRDAIKPSEDPPIDVDDTWNDIWYLDNPGEVHTNGLISAAATSRGSMTVFALSGTAPGAGNWVIGTRDTRSAELSTSATGSIVIASFGTGGAGNTADVQNVTADAPLTQTSSTKNGGGRNWDGHVTGYAVVDSVGPGTYSFTGGNEDGAHVIAAEFLAADGTAGPPFAITAIDYSSADGVVTLSWNAEPETLYTVFFARNPRKLAPGEEGDGDAGDGFEDNDEGGVDLDPAEGKITIEIQNPDPEAEDLFFSVHEN